MTKLQNKKSKLSIIIPCYNEERNLPLILDRFAVILNKTDVPNIEVVMVNNGSTDQSAKVFQTLCPQYSFVKQVHVPINQGYGFGILSGLRAASGEYLGWTHADLQTDPYDVARGYAILEQQGFPTNVFVKGNRQGRPLFDNFFTVGMSCFETIYLKQKLWDINAQPNLFHRSFFTTWQKPPHDFSLDLYALYQAHRHTLKIIRFPVTFEQRLHGTSSWNTGLPAKWKFIKRTIKFSHALKGNNL